MFPFEHLICENTLKTYCIFNKLQKLEDALIKHMLTADDLADRGDLADMGDICGIGERGDMGDMGNRGDMGDRDDKGNIFDRG